LLSDSGVGKPVLAMVLAGKEFRATESTHGRRIWQLPATDRHDEVRAHLAGAWGLGSCDPLSEL